MDLEILKEMGGKKSGSISHGIVGRSIFVMLGSPVRQIVTPDTNLA